MEALKYEQEIAYTCGLLFTEKLDKLVVILKNRGPTVNRGTWNGIGGKIEAGEGIRGCMSREAREETNLVTDPTEWTIFHTETYGPSAIRNSESKSRVHYLAAAISAERFAKITQTTDEALDVLDSIYPLPAVHRGRGFASGMEYLVPMAIRYMKHPEQRYLEG